MKKLYFFLFFLININVFSQNFDETLFLADETYKNEDYPKALKIYKRLVFFSNNNYNLFKNVANCYLKQKDYKQGIVYLDSALIYCSDKNEKTNIQFLKVETLIFLEDYYSAENLLENIQISPQQNLKKNFYLGIVNFAKADYLNSKKYFLISVNDTSITQKEKIKKAFENIKKLKRPNPKIARTLSLIIPGAGQLYCGDYKNAVNSFVLVSVFAAIGTDMYFRYAWYDSLISVFPWFYRYYNGGSNNAMQFAKQKRLLKRNKKLNELLKIIDF